MVQPVAERRLPPGSAKRIEIPPLTRVIRRPLRPEPVAAAIIEGGSGELIDLFAAATGIP